MRLSPLVLCCVEGLALGATFGEKPPPHVDPAGEQLIEDDERQCAEEEQDFNFQDGGD